MDLKQFTLLIGVACLPGMTTAATVYRTISKVEAISVDCSTICRRRSGRERRGWLASYSGIYAGW